MGERTPWHYRHIGEGERRDYDEAIEALRRTFCRLQQYEFWLNDPPAIVRVPSKHGGWVRFEDVHALFDTEVVDAAIASERVAAAIADAKEGLR